MSSSWGELGPTDSKSKPPTWIRLVLGLVLALGGLVALGDVTLATTVSTLLIGAVAIGVGAFEIIHAFWTRGWSSLGAQVILGILYVVCGIALISLPTLAALALTYVIGLVLLLSGFVRTLIGVIYRKDFRWTMLISGLFGILAGLVILTGFPRTSLWALGFLLGIDLLAHGVAWLTYGWFPARRTD